MHATTSLLKRWPNIWKLFTCAQHLIQSQMLIMGTVNRSQELLLHWIHRVRHWSSMFRGTSYYHQPQRLGRRFVAGELSGYFNDLTGKTAWKGNCDHNGLPVSTLSNGLMVHFPILLCQ